MARTGVVRTTDVSVSFTAVRAAAPRYRIVSADDHLIEPPDLFEGRMPEALADRASGRPHRSTGPPGLALRGQRLPQHRPQRGGRPPPRRVVDGRRQLRRDAPRLLGHPCPRPGHGPRRHRRLGLLPVVDRRLRRHGVLALAGPQARPGVRAGVERLAPRGVGRHLPRPHHPDPDHVVARPRGGGRDGAGERRARVPGAELHRVPVEDRLAVGALRPLGPAPAGVRRRRRWCACTPARDRGRRSRATTRPSRCSRPCSRSTPTWPRPTGSGRALAPVSRTCTSPWPKAASGG